MMHGAEEKPESTPQAGSKVEPLRGVNYGPHERQILDFWPAQGEGPRPVAVFIHGGGWRNGNLSSSRAAAQPFLDHGISYVAITYRLAPEHPLPAPVHDAARAIQFLRHKAEEWNIDKNRIAAFGGSAGGCSSLWLAFRADLADPEAEDPVLRESTRLIAAAAGNAQTTIDPKLAESWIGPEVLKHAMLWQSVGASSTADAVANYEKNAELYREFSPYNHLIADDPPVMLTYARPTTLPAEDTGHAIHHPIFGIRLKEKSDSLGHELHLLVGEEIQDSKYPSQTKFLIDKLTASAGDQ